MLSQSDNLSDFFFSLKFIDATMSSKPATPKKNDRYKYENLADLKPNTVANVYGVVKFTKPPFRSKGSGKTLTDCMIKQTCYLYVILHRFIINGILFIYLYIYQLLRHSFHQSRSN